MEIANTNRAYHVQVKVYPANLKVRFLPEEDQPFDFRFNSHDHKLLFTNSPLSTLIYNTESSLRTCFSGTPLSQEMDWSLSASNNDLADYLADYCHHKTFFSILENQCIACVHIFRINMPEKSLDPYVATRIGAHIFNVTKPVNRLVYYLIKELEEADLAYTNRIAPFDCLNELSENIFVERAEWAAWASTSFFEVGPDTEKTHDFIVTAENGQVSSQFISGMCGTMQPILANYYAWKLKSTRGSNDDASLITDSLEPIIFALSERSITASACRNIKNTLEEVVDFRKINMNASDLRRYIANLRVSIYNTEIYNESSDKYSRKIYNFSRNQIGLPVAREHLETSILTAGQIIDGLQSEHEEKLQKNLNLFVLILTSFASISVLADAVGLIDFGASKMFNVEHRITMLLVAVFVSITFILTYTSKSFFGRPNKPKRKRHLRRH